MPTTTCASAAWLVCSNETVKQSVAVVKSNITTTTSLAATYCTIYHVALRCKRLPVNHLTAKSSEKKIKSPRL